MATIKLRTLQKELAKFDELDSDVVVQLVGNEFEDGDLLDIEADIALGFNLKRGAIVITALSSELSE